MRTVLADSGQYPPPAWGAHPPVFAPDYKSTRLRGATRPLVPIRQSLHELTGPVFGQDSLGPLDNDLTKNARNDGSAPGELLGERIGLSGQGVDEAGRVQPTLLIEAWQATDAGRSIGRTNVWTPVTNALLVFRL